MKPIDTAQREQALDIQQSFIVQAPAGSGKTEVLIQRYLALLSQSAEPEAVLAITFTRKAAAEMRNRVLDSLRLAASCPPSPPENVPEKRWQLAQQLHHWDQQQAWHLLTNPNRLRIQTIDSFYARLAQQLPLTSGLGTITTMSENPVSLYREAVEQLFSTHLENDSPHQPALISLLTHLENDYPQAEKLLCHMLASRDQWLATIRLGNQTPTALRQLLEQNLQQLQQAQLQILEAAFSACQMLPPDWREQLQCLLDYAGTLSGNKPVEKGIKFWQAVSPLLLTKSGQWRQRIKLPPASLAKTPQEKTTCQYFKQLSAQLLQGLREQETLRQALLTINTLPPDSYTNAQWTLIQALFQILHQLNVELQQVFQRHRQLDYIEVSQAALQALGEADQPTDLMLTLDYRIQHILLDEFQDTSLSQWVFLQRLTEGWEKQDGRTLFLVGDPMQSIYRFRKAESRLFSLAQQQGIGNCCLKPLYLSVNFRALPTLVDWTNHCFTAILAKQKAASEALPFRSATAFQAEANTRKLPLKAVQQHWLKNADEAQEAQKIVQLAQAALTENHTAAILVRTRHHLSQLFTALQTANISYQAFDIENLVEKPMIQDLLALTRALVHLADETAWLAVLRAPWCGARLQDLESLMTACRENRCLIWDQLQNLAAVSLRKEAYARLSRLREALQPQLAAQGRKPLAQRISTAWFALGGGVIYPGTAHEGDFKAFFQILEQCQVHEDLVDCADLEAALQTQSSNTHPLSLATNSVAVMTIHRAKGLEFDTVILPSLHRSVRRDPSTLLLFESGLLLMPQTHQPYFPLLIAPIKAGDTEQADPIYAYLYQTKQQQAQLEAIRLFYVACTRARKQLHLTASLKTDEQDKPLSPPADSLLRCLWPNLSPQEQELTAAPPLLEETQTNPPIQAQLLKRMAINNPFPLMPEAPPQPVRVATPLQWQANLLARAIGTTIHQLLYYLASLALTPTALQKQQDALLTACQARAASLLQQAGAAVFQLDAAKNQVIAALKKTLQDPIGRWILSGEHQAAHAEYKLSLIKTPDQLQQKIIDRTFIDAQGILWIVDYKTSQTTPASVTQFLQQQIQQHSPQLVEYAQALQDLSRQRPSSFTQIKLGIYWPSLSLWHAWDFENVAV
jgi:ATP-dependent helicase/nuclease subunit A